MKRSLRARIALGLLGYTLLLAATIVSIGAAMHESFEWMVLRAQLDGEMAVYLQQRAHQPDAVLPRSGKLSSYVATPGSNAIRQLPKALHLLPPGLHDDILVDGVQSAVIVREVDGQRIYMLLDVSTLESEEQMVATLLLIFSLLGAAVLVWVVWTLAGRLVRPVAELSLDIDRLQPGSGQRQRLGVPESATAEIVSIATAMNGLLDRVDALILREREFVNTVSHELRTPLAVIGGAAQLAEQQANLPDSVRKPLQRISQSAADVGQLIHLLLLLAKSPERLHESDEDFALDEWLPTLLNNHHHLIRDKDVQLELGPVCPGRLRAPPGIVQTAVSNLLRNAIENSHRGHVLISIEPAGVVRIRDSGHGMSPEEISRVYALQARGAVAATGRGIGLALIVRICEHLSWRLDVIRHGEPGTLAVLDLRHSLIEGTDTPLYPGPARIPARP